MRREDKKIIIEDLTDKINKTKHFYLADISGLNAMDNSNLRRRCFEQDIRLRVVKNTLLRKALEQSEKDFEGLYEVLKQPVSIMFTETGNAPAKLISDFRKTHEKPLLKGAFVEETLYLGDDQLEFLSRLKSREELIGDVLILLQSPAKNLMAALQSVPDRVAGAIKTMTGKKEEQEPK